VIDKLSDAGAVLTGKLAMVELAGGGGYRLPSASLTGPGLNPWDRTRWSGGSSSGSAAAVAAGLVSFAIGSETSGSIVTPASYCGVTRCVPRMDWSAAWRHGAFLDARQAGAVCAYRGGLRQYPARHRGRRSEGPRIAGKSFYYTPQYVRPLKELKIGYATLDFDERAEAPARVAFQAALAALKETGVQLVETTLPPFPYGPVLSTILAGNRRRSLRP